VLEHGQTDASWDDLWRDEPFDSAAPFTEERTLRWRAQERLIHERFGGFAGLHAIEAGAGRGLNAFLFARRGAAVTLLDRSPVALEQARRLFEEHHLPVTLRECDLFALPGDLQGAFDISMSYGLCEHFLGERRAQSVAAHLDLVRPGGLALLGVPNRFSPTYRLWMAVLKSRGSWSLGTEEPFSVAELESLARAARGEPLAPLFGSFVASVVNHGLNQALFKAGRRGLHIPQVRTPLLDRLAYELVLPVVRPAEARV
jgi:SAM-dependent methyltransferase